MARFQARYRSSSSSSSAARRRCAVIPKTASGAKNAALLSFEFRQPIEKAFTAVFFVDIGHAWGGYPSVNDFTQRSSFRPEVGYGLGIRVDTPLGPLRIDYGIGRDGGRTHFSVGQVF
jgi:outer membrane protein assembly factor BamA